MRAGAGGGSDRNLSLVPMPMMDVGHVRVHVAQGRVSVQVRVRLGGRLVMRVDVMLVVNVSVIVLHIRSPVPVGASRRREAPEQRRSGPPSAPSRPRARAGHGSKGAAVRLLSIAQLRQAPATAAPPVQLAGLRQRVLAWRASRVQSNCYRSDLTK